MAASATFALKAGVWFRRGRLLIISPVQQPFLALVRQKSHLSGCPDSPGHLSTTDSCPREHLFPQDDPDPDRAAPHELDALRESTLRLLLAAGVFHLIVGDLDHSLMLLAFATLNIALVAVQQSRNERALTTLRDLENPQPHHSGRSTSAYR